MRIAKKILIIIGALGFLMIFAGECGSQCGLSEKKWMSAAIIGALLIVLSRAFYSYLNWMQEEREKKSSRYRRHLEKQNKMSA